MAGKGGLGRGLDSLIPLSGAGLSEVPIDEIRPNPRQPRQRMDPEDIEELVGSIREHGVIQPIVITRSTEGGYVLIAGERRWTAAQRAGLTRIPAVIKDASPREMLELALVENIQRADLNPLEEGAAYQHLIGEFGLTQEEVARRVGRSRPTIANSIRLLGLPETVRAALARGEVTEGHARALLGLGNEGEIVGVFSEVSRRGLNVRQTEELVRRRRSPPATLPPAPPEPPPLDPELRAAEDLFREALGTRVEIIRKGAGGRLVIHYYDEEQLRALYDALSRT